MPRRPEKFDGFLYTPLMQQIRLVGRRSGNDCRRRARRVDISTVSRQKRHLIHAIHTRQVSAYDHRRKPHARRWHVAVLMIKSLYRGIHIKANYEFAIYATRMRELLWASSSDELLVEVCYTPIISFPYIIGPLGRAPSMLYRA